MALSVSQAQTVILNRIRDPQGVAHGDVILAVMSDAQRLVNACYGGVMIDTTFTLTEGQTLYNYSAVASDVVRFVDISVNNRPLRRVDWRELAHSNPRWMHSVGLPRMWDTCGHNVVMIVPSDVVTVDVRYIQELVDLTLIGAFAVPDPYITLVIDMVCEVLLLRQRLFPSIEEAANAAGRHSDPRVVRDL